MGEKQIIALGGGGFSMESRPQLDDYILAAAKTSRPKVCFLGTASGDSADYITRFYRAFSARGCEPTHYELFRRDDRSLTDFFLAQDIVYVGGGNTANMLAIWRVHQLDQVLRNTWEAGVVMAGISAGAVCWFESGVTDSYGEQLAPLQGGLGFLTGSFCPHFDGESERRPRYHQLVGSGELGDGHAADDGCALHFKGESLEAVVSSRAKAAAYRVSRQGEAVDESVLPASLLV